jgi:energy-coupling factor transporter ATP-binding protein EcfA2
VTASTYRKPRWLRDLLRFLPLKSQFVLSGNIRDLQMHDAGPSTVTAISLGAALVAELRRAGYAHVVSYDLVTGFQVPDDADGGTALLTRLGLSPTDGRAAAGLDLLAATLERFVRFDGDPAALIVDFASRLVVRNDVLTPVEHQLFTRALVLSHAARTRPSGPERQPFLNTVIWIVDKEGDLPDWFLVENPRIRHIPVAKPDPIVRRLLTASLLRSLPGGREAPNAELEKACQTFVEQTDGLLLVDLNAIAQLGRSEGVPFGSIADAVRRYKVGVTEDPWQKIDRARIRHAEDFIRRRVKGQDHAVTHMLDIVKRAVTGVGRSQGGRPRGVVFLAGPTGVGKTELAKTVTSLLFGDDSAYIRFDMSEFSAEHADQRLIGAPPGYVGYDVGGELTNAIRERPFSVVLFDEIEKAHPRILDKFLQILDDGVLTSGRGDRVYFSEALIIFTSNLGIYSLDAAGNRTPNVTPDEPFTAMEAKVAAEIDKHFKLVLNRPEILNRIGENIIVFDFIRPDVARMIFDHMKARLLEDVLALGYTVTITEEALAALRTLCLSDLSNGGRGIRNQIEAHLVNPLSRALFDSEARPGSQLQVRGVMPGPATMLHIAEAGT